MMADTMQLISSLVWLVLALLVFRRLMAWDKKFSDLYDELHREICERTDDE